MIVLKPSVFNPIFRIAFLPSFHGKIDELFALKIGAADFTPIKSGP
jgi:hypothetical protein